MELSIAHPKEGSKMPLVPDAQRANNCLVEARQWTRASIVEMAKLLEEVRSNNLAGIDTRQIRAVRAALASTDLVLYHLEHLANERKAQECAAALPPLGALGTPKEV